jgi:predicted RNase H-like nuclease (RuvC/YqgF family)
MNTLDTPEHAAYRASILAHGTDQHEAALAWRDQTNRIEDLTCDNESLTKELDRVETQLLEAERKISLLEAQLDELAS